MSDEYSLFKPQWRQDWDRGWVFVNPYDPPAEPLPPRGPSKLRFSQEAFQQFELLHGIRSTDEKDSV